MWRLWGVLPNFSPQGHFLSTWVYTAFDAMFSQSAASQLMQSALSLIDNSFFCWIVLY